jgi:hypothetical protein
MGKRGMEVRYDVRLPETQEKKCDSKSELRRIALEASLTPPLSRGDFQKWLIFSKDT